MANLRMPNLDKLVHIGDFGQLSTTGIYFLIHEGVVVYVGQSRNIRSRIGQHISEGAKVFDSIAHVPCAASALAGLETKYIEKLMPKYNKVGNSLRKLGIESPSGGRLIGVERKIRLPRMNVRRTITVLA